MNPNTIKRMLLIFVCIILISSIGVSGLSDLQQYVEQEAQQIYCHHNSTSEKRMLDELAMRILQKVDRDPESLEELYLLLAKNHEDFNKKLVRTRRSFQHPEGTGLAGLLSESHSNHVYHKRVDLRTLMSQDSENDSVEETLQRQKRFHIRLAKISRPIPQHNKINQEVLSKLNSIGKLEISLEKVYDVLERLHHYYDKFGYLIPKLSWLAGRSFPSWLKLTFQTLHTLTRPALSKRVRKKGAPRSSKVDISRSSDSTYESKNLQETIDVDEITTEIGRQAIILTVGLVADIIFKPDKDAPLSSKCLNDLARGVSCYLVIQFATVERLGAQCKKN